MVQINNGARLNMPTLRLNNQPTIKDDGTGLQTEGNNSGATCSRILSGNGTKDNPYVLNGATFDADMKYLFAVAKETGKAVYMINGYGTPAIVTPGGEIVNPE